MPLIWSPPIETTKLEQALLKRCAKRKLFIFLRLHRHEIFDAEMQEQLVAAYDERRRGEPAVPPAQLAMAALLQAAFNVPDHEVPELLVVERRWQMVLDCANVDEPPFTQATVHRFRQRLIEHGLDQALFEKTIALAKKSGAFGAAKLRAAFDACPLYGAGRVEDTFNLIGRAAFHVVRTAAARLDKSVEEVALAAGIPVVVASSIKAGLDIDWDDPNARRIGLQTLLTQVAALTDWLHAELGAELDKPPLSDDIATLAALIEQDTDPDPNGGLRTLKQGVAKDRVMSLGDKQMRHGRKSKRQRIDGYKRHIAVDIDSPQFIIGVAVTPANRPEREASKELLEQIEARGRRLDELQIDRGYLGDAEIEARRLRGMRVVSKPFPLHNKGLFTKADFRLDLDSGTATCPNDIVVPLRLGAVLHFPDAACSPCPKRSACTRARDHRSLTIHDNESFLLELRSERKTKEGRLRARDRVCVEHALARLATRSGRRARYRGVRNNLFDQRRHAAVVNLRALASLAA
jgi:hypothetical protein